MCRAPIQLLAGLAMILGTASSEAEGTVITFAFSGAITSVSDRDGILGGAVGVGNPFDGVYSFESTTPDSDPTEPRRGQYLGALTALDGQLGALSFVAPPGFGSFIEIQDGFSAPTIDQYRVVAETEIVGRVLTFGLILLDDFGVALQSDQLPLLPPTLEHYQTTRFIISSEPAGVSIVGDLTILIPEPGGLCALGLGAVFVAMRRRASRSNLGVSE